MIRSILVFLAATSASATGVEIALAAGAAGVGMGFGELYERGYFYDTWGLNNVIRHETQIGGDRFGYHSSRQNPHSLGAAQLRINDPWDLIIKLTTNEQEIRIPWTSLQVPLRQPNSLGGEQFLYGQTSFQIIDVSNSTMGKHSKVRDLVYDQLSKIPIHSIQNAIPASGDARNVYYTLEVSIPEETEFLFRLLRDQSSLGIGGAMAVPHYLATKTRHGLGWMQKKVLESLKPRVSSEPVEDAKQNESVGDDDNDTTCAICFDKDTPYVLVQTACKHSFCWDCLSKWLQSEKGRVKQRCPLCNRNNCMSIEAPTAVEAVDSQDALASHTEERTTGTSGLTRTTGLSSAFDVADALQEMRDRPERRTNLQTTPEENDAIRDIGGTMGGSLFGR